MIPRTNDVHWEGLVYVEMFIAGIAAGAYAIGALLELFGRGRSSVARASHLLALPLMAMAAFLLILDLSRPERFLHMIVQSKTLLPMFKPWSTMSMGSWLVMLFPAFAFVSFVDALIARGTFSLPGWRRDRTVHGSAFGKVWAALGGLAALGVGTYSGVLLGATQFPGWADSPLIGALFVATALATGMAALLLIASIGAGAESADRRDLVRGSAMVILWQLMMLVVFLVTMRPGGYAVFLTGLPLVAFILAAVIGGIVPLFLLRFGAGRVRPATTALVAVMVLVGGFLVRFGVVIGPQRYG